MGYIGSSRMLYDMKQNVFPDINKHYSTVGSNIKQIHFNDLSFYLEIQQLKSNSDFFVHTDFSIYKKNSSLVCILKFLK